MSEITKYLKNNVFICIKRMQNPFSHSTLGRSGLCMCINVTTSTEWSLCVSYCSRYSRFRKEQGYEGWWWG